MGLGTQERNLFRRLDSRLLAVYLLLQNLSCSTFLSISWQRFISFSSHFSHFKLISTSQSVHIHSVNIIEIEFSQFGGTMVIFNRNELALYDASLLLKLDFHKSPAKFEPFISAAAPGETWLKVRPLQDGDYDRGFLQLLSQLTSVGEVTKSQFLSRFAQMRASGDYYVTVIEDTRINKIIGAATLVIEHKFIHGCGVRGRLEDVVVNNTYRGKQLGKLIVVTVTLLAQLLGCYKMSLDCKDKLIKFYESLGYVLEPGNSNSMTIRYEMLGNVTKNLTSSTSPVTMGLDVSS